MTGRILIDGRSAFSGRTSGWERYTQELVRGLAGDDDVVVHRAGGRSFASRVVGDAVVLPARSRRFSLTHFPSFPPAPWSGAGLLVYTLYDLTWWRYPETASRGGRYYYRRLAEKAVQRADLVLTISETVALEIQDHFGLTADRVRATPLGSSLPAGAARFHGERPYLLAVGSVEPRKNLDRLLEAYGRSAVRHTHDLLLVGRSAWGQLPAGARLVQGVDDETLAGMYVGADAVVAVSLYEGFGLPLVEGLAAGTKLVCSDIPVFHEVAGSAAVYVDPLNVDSIAHALDVVVHEPDLAGEHRRRAQEMTWDKTIASVRAAYDDLLGRE